MHQLEYDNMYGGNVPGKRRGYSVSSVRTWDVQRRTALFNVLPMRKRSLRGDIKGNGVHVLSRWGSCADRKELLLPTVHGW